MTLSDWQCGQSTVTSCKNFAMVVPPDGCGTTTANQYQFIQGIVLTAIAGAISAFLSFIGIIKGIVDNLTRDDSSPQ